MNEPQLECIDCMSAATGVHHGFKVGCRSCEARMVARSQEFALARSADRSTAAGEALRDQYRVLLNITGITHEEVKAAAAIDERHKESAS